MDNKGIDVDDILNEIAFKKTKDVSGGSKIDMQSINDMIEQILKDKKTAQLEKESSNPTQKEMEEIQKEIRIQTKSITKQFERAVKENTRQIKRTIREEKSFDEEVEIEKEKSEIFSIEKEFLNKNTQQLKLSAIAQNQTVKLAKPPSEIVETKEKQEKLDFLKLSAHNKIIKREIMDITSHFGNFANKDTNQNFIDENGKTDDKKSFITPSGFKELKKNRNKRIEKFVLNPEKDPKKAVENIEEINDENENEQILDVQNEVPKDGQNNEKEIKNLVGQTQVLDENVAETIKGDDDEAELKSIVDTILDEDYNDESDFEFTKKEQTQTVFTKLLKKRHSAKVKVVVFSVLSIIALFISFFTTGKNGIKLFSFEIQPIAYAGINLILLLISTGLVFGCFKNAFKSIIKKAPSKDILYSITVLIALVANIIFVFAPENLKNPNVHIFTPVVIISLLFYSLSKLYYATQTYDNFCYIANEDSDKFTITKVNNVATAVDMTGGLLENEIDNPVLLVKNVQTKFFDNFIANSKATDESDVRLSKISIFALPVAFVFAILAFAVTKNLYVALTALVAVMTMTTTLIGAMLVIFPLNDTSKITRHFGEMSPCVASIDGMAEVNSILIEAYDLFPSESVILHGIKTFSGKRIDDAILDAASVVCQSKSILSNVFLNIIAQNNELLKPVDTILYEDLMGLSAWVDNKRVLIGNRELMINHSIPVPSKNYEEKYTQINQQVVYLASEGELAAAFVIQLTAVKESFDATSLLERNGIKMIIKTADAIIIPERLVALFHLDENSIKILPSRLHKAYKEEMQIQEKADVLVGNNGTFIGGIISTVATKKMSYCINFGNKMNLFQIIFGIIIIACFLLLGKFAMITNIAIILYMLCFSAIYWIFQKNVRL